MATDPRSRVRYPGNDHHYGGPGRDFIEDLAGVDVLVGGGGDDACLAASDGDGRDRLNGGNGFDTWFSEFTDTLIDVESRRDCLAA